MTNVLLSILGIALFFGAAGLLIRLLWLSVFTNEEKRARDFKRRSNHLIDTWKWRRQSARDAVTLHEVDRRFLDTIRALQPDMTLRASAGRLWAEAVLLIVAITLAILAGVALIAPLSADYKAADAAAAADVAELNEWAVSTYGLAENTDLSTFTALSYAERLVAGCDGINCVQGTVFQGDQLVDVTLKTVGEERILAVRGPEAGLSAPELPRVEKVGKHSGK